VFEGLDRSGKSTQAARTLAWLRGRGSLVTEEVWRFPDRTTPTGQIISAYLSKTQNLDNNAQHLIFSANRWEKAAQLRQTLEEGTHVIADRYAFSGVAYSVGAKGLDWTWCTEPDRGLPAPDLVIFLDIDPADVARRGEFGRERYEELEIQERVRAAFVNMASQIPVWKIIDVRGAGADEVEHQVRDEIEAALSRPVLPLETLWWDRATTSSKTT